MKGDIALAGFMMTPDEWEALDPASRALLIAIAGGSEGELEAVQPEPSGVVRMLARGSAPHLEPDPTR